MTVSPRYADYLDAVDSGSRAPVAVGVQKPRAATPSASPEADGRELEGAEAGQEEDTARRACAATPQEALAAQGNDRQQQANNGATSADLGHVPGPSTHTPPAGVESSKRSPSPPPASLAATGSLNLVADHAAQAESGSDSSSRSNAGAMPRVRRRRQTWFATSCLTSATVYSTCLLTTRCLLAGSMAAQGA